MSFSAVLFIHITKSVFVPPFNNVDSLITDTTYNIVSLKDTLEAYVFKVYIYSIDHVLT